LEEDEKETKVVDNGQVVKETRILLDKFCNVILDMEVNRGIKFLNWIRTHTKYLEWEIDFDPTRLRRYSRGEIILINFGFNVGSEQGGLHWAVVINEDVQQSKSLIVVPLTSPKKDEDLTKGYRINLGKIGINEKESIARVDQVRTISKLRIYKPRKGYQKVNRLDNTLLDLIDKKFIEIMESAKHKENK